MIIYTILSAICIVMLAAIAFSFFVECKSRDRAALIEFLRKFKKGKCAIIYIAAIPLYFIGFIYAEMPVPQAIFTSFNRAVSLVALGFNFGSIDKLIKLNPVYAAAVYICFIMVSINAAIFFISLGHQRFWAWRQSKKWHKNDCDKCLIIGNNPENLNICKTRKNITEKDKLGHIIVDDLSATDKNSLFTDGVPFLHVSEEKSKIVEKIKLALHSKKTPKPRKDVDIFEAELENLLKMAVSDADFKYTVIINTGNEDLNLSLCRKSSDFINNYLDSLNSDVIAAITEEQKALIKKKKKQTIKLFSRLGIYVFGDARYDAIYAKIIESSHGCLHYLNKYRQIAIDFIDKYPLTSFMTSEQIDYDTSCIKENIDINVFFIGFGKTAQQIFLTSVANNQFICDSNGKKILKPVKYHIFDKVKAENDKNLNHSYYRYRNEFFNDEAEKLFEKNETLDYPYKSKYLKDSVKQKEYLPLPQFPADEYYHKLDINDPDFYNQLRITACSSPSNINCVIIAFGSDLENLDMAHKLIDKKQEWEIENFTVFVKSNNPNTTDPIFHREQKDCILIGDPSNTVYVFDKITNNDLLQLAIKRHKIYSLEYDLAHGYADSGDQESINASFDNAIYNWFVERTQIERDSNLYATLSLRSKLNLMGMDCVSKNADGKALDDEEYMNDYARDDRPVPLEGADADGKTIWKYTLDFPDSRRKSMAIHEHYRWNSYMISHGIVPADIEKISGEQIDGKFTSGKNYPLRRHGNLTTFEGLETFRRIVSDRNKSEEAEEDVIKYEYQLLDDAPWFLDGFGYKIIQRKK